MQVRGWGNALAFAGLFIAVGGTLVQAPQIFGLTPKDVSWLRIIFFASLLLAILAMIFLRPTKETKNLQRLHDLRSKLSVRDMTFLKIASSITHYPEFISDETHRLAPQGGNWNKESKTEAENRAKRLTYLGLLQWRGSEVETTDDGKAVISYDAVISLSGKS